MAKEAYWIKRERDHIEKSIKDDKIITKKLQQNYDRALNEITKEIDAFYSKYAAKEGISMADAIKKVKQSDTKAFANKAKKYVEEKDFSDVANSRLRLYNLTMKVNRLEMLKADIGLELVAMSNDEEKIMRSALEKNVYDEFERQAGILGETVLNNQKTIKDIVNASFQNATFSERVWSNQDALKAELDKLLSRGMIQGKNPRVLAREIKKTFGVSTRQSERLMVTELARTQTAAQERSFKEYGFEQYVYIPEPTACSICKPLDGKVFSVKDMMPGVNAPVMHPFCRCSTAAYVDRDAFEADLKARGLIDEPKQETVFEPAKNLKEANKYAMDKLGIPNVSYKGLDVATANEWNKGLTESFRDFPKLKERFGFVGEAHERNSMLKKALTEVTMKRTIEANPNADLKSITTAVKRYVNKTTKILNVSEKSMAQSWSPTGEIFKDYAGISVNNKIGKNAVTFVDSLKKQVESKFHPVGTDSIKSVLDHEIGHQLDDLLLISNNETIQKLFDTRTQEALTNDLSKYAWDNSNKARYSEMIAEGWSEYRNNPKPREMAKTIGELIEQEYNKKYK